MITNDNVDSICSILYIIFLSIFLIIIIAFSSTILDDLSIASTDGLYWINSTLIQSNITLLGFMIVFLTLVYSRKNTELSYRAFVMLIVNSIAILISFILSQFALIEISMPIDYLLAVSQGRLLTFFSIISGIFVVIFSVLFFIVSLIFLQFHIDENMLNGRNKNHIPQEKNNKSHISNLDKNT